MEIIKQKFFEVTTSVLPVTLIALVLNFTLTPLGGPLTARLIIGAALIIAGLTIFLFGVEVLAAEQAECLPRNEEIAGRQNVDIAIPHGEFGGFHRRG